MEYEVVDAYGHHLGYVHIETDLELRLIKRSILVSFEFRKVVVY